jgi:hypothetical protein
MLRKDNVLGGQCNNLTEFKKVFLVIEVTNSMEQIFLEKLIAAHLGMKFYAFMELEGSLHCSQELTTDPCSELV